MNEIINRFIMNAYFAVLKNSQFPSVAAVFRMFNDLINREAADIMYPDIDFKKVNEEIIFDTLIRFRCAHSNSGIIYFDARNELFENFDENKIILLPEKTTVREEIKDAVKITYF